MFMFISDNWSRVKGQALFSKGQGPDTDRSTASVILSCRLSRQSRDLKFSTHVILKLRIFLHTSYNIHLDFLILLDWGYNDGSATRFYRPVNPQVLRFMFRIKIIVNTSTSREKFIKFLLDQKIGQIKYKSARLTENLWELVGLLVQTNINHNLELQGVSNKEKSPMIFKILFLRIYRF